MTLYCIWGSRKLAERVNCQWIVVYLRARTTTTWRDEREYFEHGIIIASNALVWNKQAGMERKAPHEERESKLVR